MNIYTDLKGKAGRRQFLGVSVLNYFICILLLLVSRHWISAEYRFVFAILFLVLEFPVSTRRINDLGINSKFILLLLVPGVNLLFALYLLVIKAPRLPSPETIDQTELEAERCPNCNSNETYWDKSIFNVGGILILFGITKRKLIRDYKCYECGHSWQK